jgi:hypothetical protein
MMTVCMLQQPLPAMPQPSSLLFRCNATTLFAALLFTLCTSVALPVSESYADMALYLSQQGFLTLVCAGQHMVVLVTAYSLHAGFRAQKEQPAGITCYAGVSSSVGSSVCTGQHMVVLVTAYSLHAGFKAQKEQPAGITCYTGVSGSVGSSVCAGQHVAVLVTAWS